MKRLNYLCLVGLLFASAASAARGESIEWVRQLGTSATDYSWGVSADGLGNVYISGLTTGSLGGPSAGGGDAFVSKYDAAGTLQWSRQLGTSSGDTSFGVSADGLGNVYISGETTGSLGGPYAGDYDAFVSKYDAAGTFQWTQQLGTSGGDTSNGVSADGLGNVYISGYTTGSLGGPNAGPFDAFVGKYDAAGTFQWSRQLGTSASDQSYGVSADGLGNVYISGLTDGSLGGPNAGGSDAFVSKYDAAGTLQWSRQLGTSSTDVSYGVSADDLGNIYLSGYTNGGSLGGPNAGISDAFVSKYDAAGTLQWTRQLGTSSGDVSYGVSADGLGNVYISGRTGGSLGGPYAGGGSDAFVSKYDASGTLQWSRQLETNTADRSFGVSADGLGNVYFSGSTDGNLGGPSADNADAFVVKIADAAVPEPNTLLLLCFGSLAVLWRRRRLVCATILAAVVSIAISAQAVTIDMVTVGNPGNAADTRFNATGFGSVDHVYQIGKYEVTAGQYTEFLNAVAKADPNGLYNAYMGDIGATSQGANIQQTGSSPTYSYSVAADWADRPVNYVSFWDAARFANWLHNGQPTGAQGPGTTEDGAYLNVGNQTTFARQPGARFFIPTENEWYKAAYHKNDGGTGNYWDYPTATNTEPINTLPDPGNHANFYDALGTGNNSYTIGSPYYRTEAGAFINSPSPYGTFDQVGNVFEWNETKVTSSSRGFRGGSFYNASNYLPASSRVNFPPTLVTNDVGFRVASNIPEPSTLLLLCLGSLAVLWRRRGLACAAILAAVVSVSFADRAAADTFDMVTVGNSGNAPDTEVMITDGTTGYGSVGYAYQIGKYEVTAGQYTEFLNAVAKSDPNGLYNTSMVSTLGANIVQSGSSPNFSYSVASDWADRPVNYVSFWDAARFANWLHNGQPTGAQGPGTTEDGAYLNVGNQSTFARQTGARFFIPTEDEWYKAAYHDKTAGLAASYFDYPTGMNSLPGRDMTEATNSGNNANYYSSGYLIGSPYYRTVFGEFELSDSPYGTFDQGGNVWEWNETVSASSFRALRGGSFSSGSNSLHASYRDRNGPAFENYFVGFRVASNIPEPSTLLLLCFGSLAVLWRRRGLACAAILAIVFTNFSADRARGESIEWTRQLGTSVSDRSNSVSADGLGNVYISGFTAGSLGGPNPTPGFFDAFVAKIADPAVPEPSTFLLAALSFAGLLLPRRAGSRERRTLIIANQPVESVWVERHSSGLAEISVD